MKTSDMFTLETPQQIILTRGRRFRPRKINIRDDKFHVGLTAEIEREFKA
jgi:hypothetical protein